MHEEPFGLAVAEVLLLPVVAGARRPLRLLVGPEHREAVSAPFPVVGEAGPARGGRGLRVQHRGGPDPPPEGSPRRVGVPAPGGGRRPVPGAGPRAAGRHPVGRVRRSSHPPQGGRRPPRGGGARPPLHRRDLRLRSRVRTAGGPGRHARHPGSGHLPTATSTTTGSPTSIPGSTWSPSRPSRCPAGSSSSAGWWPRPRRPGSRWWPAPAAPSPTSSATPACWCRPATRPPSDAALARFLDEPGLWARLRELGMAEVARYSWKSIADSADGPLPGRHLG